MGDGRGAHRRAEQDVVPGEEPRPCGTQPALLLPGQGRIARGLGDVAGEPGGRRLVRRIEPGRPAGQRGEVGFRHDPGDPALDQPLSHVEGLIEIHRPRLFHAHPGRRQRVRRLRQALRHRTVERPARLPRPDRHPPITEVAGWRRGQLQAPGSRFRRVRSGQHRQAQIQVGGAAGQRPQHADVDFGGHSRRWRNMAVHRDYAE